MTEFTDVTKQSTVDTYQTAIGVFSALLKEVRELSKKKPDATLSAGKVKLINRVLTDLTGFLAKEPEGKYLSLLEDEELPQVSDALMMMVQFEAALKAFSDRYYVYIPSGRVRLHGAMVASGHYWITEEFLAPEE